MPHLLSLSVLNSCRQHILNFLSSLRFLHFCCVQFLFCSTYFGVYEHGKRLLSLRGDHSSNTTSVAINIAPSSSNSINSGPRQWSLPASVAVPLAGGTSGCLAWFLSYPLDCVKSNLQGGHLVAPKVSDMPRHSINNSSISSMTSLHKSSSGAQVGNIVGVTSSQSTWRAPPKPSAWSVARHLVAMRGVRGLYSGLAPSLARAFVVSGSRFSAYEFALWVLNQGKAREEH